MENAILELLEFSKNMKVRFKADILYGFKDNDLEIYIHGLKVNHTYKIEFCNFELGIKDSLNDIVNDYKIELIEFAIGNEEE